MSNTLPNTEQMLGVEPHILPDNTQMLTARQGLQAYSPSLSANATSTLLGLGKTPYLLVILNFLNC